eukprot:47631-Pelagomonas_calceolata.AAC.1
MAHQAPANLTARILCQPSGYVLADQQHVYLKCKNVETLKSGTQLFFKKRKSEKKNYIGSGPFPDLSMRQEQQQHHQQHKHQYQAVNYSLLTQPGWFTTPYPPSRIERSIIQSSRRGSWSGCSNKQQSACSAVSTSSQEALYLLRT